MRRYRVRLSSCLARVPPRRPPVVTRPERDNNNSNNHDKFIGRAIRDVTWRLYTNIIFFFIFFFLELFSRFCFGPCSFLIKSKTMSVLLSFYRFIYFLFISFNYLF